MSNESEKKSIWEFISHNQPIITAIAQKIAKKIRINGIIIEPEDLVQDAMLKILKYDEKSEYYSDEHIKNILWKILNYVAHDHIRKHKRNKIILDEKVHALKIYGTDNSISTLDIAELISTLDIMDQAIIKYRLEGFTHEEIAQYFNINADHVRKRYQRALDKLSMKIRKNATNG